MDSIKGGFVIPNVIIPDHNLMRRIDRMWEREKKIARKDKHLKIPKKYEIVQAALQIGLTVLENRAVAADIKAIEEQEK